MKCGGKSICYRWEDFQNISETDRIAGYTLIYNSYGMILSAHEPFESERISN